MSVSDFYKLIDDYVIVNIISEYFSFNLYKGLPNNIPENLLDNNIIKISAAACNQCGSITFKIYV